VIAYPSSGAVLDTHAWIWFVSSPGLLSRRAAEEISRAQLKNALYISSISAWEVAMLVARKQLVLRMDVDSWIAKSESLPFLQFVAVDNCVSMKSVFLGTEIPSDPVDRIIAATAVSLGFPLVSKDVKMRQVPGLEVVW